jgi:3',5'-cyclic-nucleotide phosphodiesterase
MHLLTHIASEISSRNFPKLVVPVVMLSGLDNEPTSTGPLPSPGLHMSYPLGDAVRWTRYLDAGAVDVLTSPIAKDRMLGLLTQAYRLQKEFAREEASFLTTKRNRKLSWVGVDDTKPYAYLREAMVSGLMTGICNPETVGDSLEPTYVATLRSTRCANMARDFDLDLDRRMVVENAVGTWAFSAHDFTDDELLYSALIMLKHALKMPELEKWAINQGKCTCARLVIAANTDTRRAHRIPPSQSYSVQRIRQIPQFPPRRRRPPSSLPLPCPHRHIASIPLELIKHLHSQISDSSTAQAF